MQLASCRARTCAHAWRPGEGDSILRSRREAAELSSLALECLENWRVETMPMRTCTATVQNGAVKLPPDANVEDGARVVVAVLDVEPRGCQLLPYPPDLAAENVAFVQFDATAR